jgi:hypothetical protein
MAEIDIIGEIVGDICQSPYKSILDDELIDMTKIHNDIAEINKSTVEVVIGTIVVMQFAEDLEKLDKRIDTIYTKYFGGDINDALREREERRKLIGGK